MLRPDPEGLLKPGAGLALFIVYGRGVTAAHTTMRHTDRSNKTRDMHKHKHTPTSVQWE